MSGIQLVNRVDGSRHEYRLPPGTPRRQVARLARHPQLAPRATGTKPGAGGRLEPACHGFPPSARDEEVRGMSASGVGFGSARVLRGLPRADDFPNVAAITEASMPPSRPNVFTAHSSNSELTNVLNIPESWDPFIGNDGHHALRDL